MSEDSHEKATPPVADSPDLAAVQNAFLSPSVLAARRFGKRCTTPKSLRPSSAETVGGRSHSSRSSNTFRREHENPNALDQVTSSTMVNVSRKEGPSPTPVEDIFSKASEATSALLKSFSSEFGYSNEHKTSKEFEEDVNLENEYKDDNYFSSGGSMSIPAPGKVEESDIDNMEGEEKEQFVEEEEEEDEDEIVALERQLQKLKREREMAKLEEEIAQMKATMAKSEATENALKDVLNNDTDKSLYPDNTFGTGASSPFSFGRSPLKMGHIPPSGNPHEEKEETQPGCTDYIFCFGNQAGSVEETTDPVDTIVQQVVAEDNESNPVDEEQVNQTLNTLSATLSLQQLDTNKSFCHPIEETENEDDSTCKDDNNSINGDFDKEETINNFDGVGASASKDESKDGVEEKEQTSTIEKSRFAPVEQNDDNQAKGSFSNFFCWGNDYIIEKPPVADVAENKAKSVAENDANHLPEHEIIRSLLTKSGSDLEKSTDGPPTKSNVDLSGDGEVLSIDKKTESTQQADEVHGPSASYKSVGSQKDNDDSSINDMQTEKKTQESSVHSSSYLFCCGGNYVDDSTEPNVSEVVVIPPASNVVSGEVEEKAKSYEEMVEGPTTSTGVEGAVGLKSVPSEKSAIATNAESTEDVEESPHEAVVEDASGIKSSGSRNEANDTIVVDEQPEKTTDRPRVMFLCCTGDNMDDEPEVVKQEYNEEGSRVDTGNSVKSASGSFALNETIFPQITASQSKCNSSQISLVDSKAGSFAADGDDMVDNTNRSDVPVDAKPQRSTVLSCMCIGEAGYVPSDLEATQEQQIDGDIKHRRTDTSFRANENLYPEHTGVETFSRISRDATADEVTELEPKAVASLGKEVDSTVDENSQADWKEPVADNLSETPDVEGVLHSVAEVKHNDDVTQKPASSSIFACFDKQVASTAEDMQQIDSGEDAADLAEMPIVKEAVDTSDEKDIDDTKKKPSSSFFACFGTEAETTVGAKILQNGSEPLASNLMETSRVEGEVVDTIVDDQNNAGNSEKKPVNSSIFGCFGKAAESAVDDTISQTGSETATTNMAETPTIGEEKVDTMVVDKNKPDEMEKELSYSSNKEAEIAVDEELQQSYSDREMVNVTEEPTLQKEIVDSIVEDKNNETEVEKKPTSSSIFACFGHEDSAVEDTIHQTGNETATTNMAEIPIVEKGKMDSILEDKNCDRGEEKKPTNSSIFSCFGNEERAVEGMIHQTGSETATANMAETATNGEEKVDALVDDKTKPDELEKEQANSSIFACYGTEAEAAVDEEVHQNDSDRVTVNLTEAPIVEKEIVDSILEENNNATEVEKKTTSSSIFACFRTEESAVGETINKNDSESGTVNLTETPRVKGNMDLVVDDDDKAKEPATSSIFACFGHEAESLDQERQSCSDPATANLTKTPEVESTMDEKVDSATTNLKGAPTVEGVMDSVVDDKSSFGPDTEKKTKSSSIFACFGKEAISAVEDTDQIGSDPVSTNLTDAPIIKKALDSVDGKDNVGENTETRLTAFSSIFACYGKDEENSICAGRMEDGRSIDILEDKVVDTAMGGDVVDSVIDSTKQDAYTEESTTAGCSGLTYKFETKTHKNADKSSESAFSYAQLCNVGQPEKNFPLCAVNTVTETNRKDLVPLIDTVDTMVEEDDQEAGFQKISRKKVNLGPWDFICGDIIQNEEEKAVRVDKRVSKNFDVQEESPTEYIVRVNFSLEEEKKESEEPQLVTVHSGKVDPSTPEMEYIMSVSEKVVQNMQVDKNLRESAERRKVDPEAAFLYAVADEIKKNVDTVFSSEPTDKIDSSPELQYLNAVQKDLESLITIRITEHGRPDEPISNSNLPPELVAIKEMAGSMPSAFGPEIAYLSQVARDMKLLFLNNMGPEIGFLTYSILGPSPSFAGNEDRPTQRRQQPDYGTRQTASFQTAKVDLPVQSTHGVERLDLKKSPPKSVQDVPASEKFHDETDIIAIDSGGDLPFDKMKRPQNEITRNELNNSSKGTVPSQGDSLSVGKSAMLNTAPHTEDDNESSKNAERAVDNGISGKRSSGDGFTSHRPSLEVAVENERDLNIKSIDTMCSPTSGGDVEVEIKDSASSIENQVEADQVVDIAHQTERSSAIAVKELSAQSDEKGEFGQQQVQVTVVNVDQTTDLLDQTEKSSPAYNAADPSAKVEDESENQEQVEVTVMNAEQSQGLADQAAYFDRSAVAVNEPPAPSNTATYECDSQDQVEVYVERTDNGAKDEVTTEEDVDAIIAAVSSAKSEVTDETAKSDDDEAVENITEEKQETPGIVQVGSS